MLKFNSAWRFEDPERIPEGVVREFFGLIGKIAAQGNRKEIFEDFKDYFARSMGESSTSSSSESWAETDLQARMDEAARNAPMFIDAFYSACESFRNTDIGIPDVRVINKILAKYETGYEIRPPKLVRHDDNAESGVGGADVEVPRPSFNSIASEQPKSRRKDVESRSRVFLCHSKADKSAVRDLYKRLQNDGFDPWLDEEDLLPGHDWEREITSAVRASAVVVVCLSRMSTNREGYVHKEIKQALDVADRKPEGSIFIIPLRLEDCDVPDRLARWQWVDLFESTGYEKLSRVLRRQTERMSTDSGR